jgi:hypothetical protein
MKGTGEVKRISLYHPGRATVDKAGVLAVDVLVSWWPCWLSLLPPNSRLSFSGTICLTAFLLMRRLKSYRFECGLLMTVQGAFFLGYSSLPHAVAGAVTGKLGFWAIASVMGAVLLRIIQYGDPYSRIRHQPDTGLGRTLIRHHKPPGSPNDLGFNDESKAT